MDRQRCRGHDRQTPQRSGSGSRRAEKGNPGICAQPNTVCHSGRNLELDQGLLPNHFFYPQIMLTYLFQYIQRLS